MHLEHVRKAFARAMTAPSDEAVCIAALASHHGIGHDPGSVGKTMLDIYTALADVGLDVRGYEATLSSLRTLEAPGILHLDDEGGGAARFVVCYGFQSGTYVVGDPRQGIRRYTPTDLARRWKSRALLYAEGPVQAGLDRYRCFDVEVVGFGTGRVLVRARRTGRVRVLPGEAARDLLMADAFHTLETHAARMSQRTNGDAADAESWRTWVGEGMLTSESAIREEIMHCMANENAASPCTDRITTIGVPTRDRNEQVLACLRSYLENATASGRRVQCAVADASSPVNQAWCKPKLQELQDEFDVVIEHLDDAWRADLIRFVREEVDCRPEVLRFSLHGDPRCGTNYGANRNALLLATLGELTVQVDDDTRLPLSEAPDSWSGMALSSKPDPNEYWFGEGSEGWAAMDGVGFLELHEELLGHRAVGLLRPYGDRGIKVDDLQPGLLRRLSSAWIGLTFLGHVGDAGSLTNVPRLFADGATRNRLAGAEYEACMRSRDMGRAVMRRTISDGFFCMGMNMGLDNRWLLPPFMPVGRNEDGLFSKVLNVVCPSLLRGFHEGYAIGHVPTRPREPFSKCVHFDGFRMNDLVDALIGEEIVFGAVDVAPRLRLLGDRLMTYGSLGASDFEDLCRTVVHRTVGMIIARAERALAGPGGSMPSLHADLSSLMVSLEDFVTQDTCHVPIDLNGDVGMRGALFQDIVGTYGEMLKHWPDIVLCVRHAAMERGFPRLDRKEDNP